MLLFTLPPYEELGGALAALARLVPGRGGVGRFANGELRAQIDTPVAARACAVLGAVAPPDVQLLSTSLLAHTLRAQGARRVVAVVPYLAYARQDRPEPGRSLAAAWVGELLRASGVGEILTVDVHSPAIHALSPVPVRSLSPAALFAGAIAAAGLGDATVVAPDEGARDRAEAVRRAAGLAPPLAYLVKVRTEAGVSHAALEGAVSRRAVVVDDILDTGGTLVSCCRALRQAGVEDIAVMVTHGLFTGTGWERLWSLGVTRLLCTDTVPAPRGRDPRIAVVSVARLLADHLAAPAPPETG